MKKIWQIISYFNYNRKAVTRYKIHSPFVYELIEKVFRDKTNYPELTDLDRVHRRYARRKDKIETADYGAGAGNKKYKRRIRKVGKLVRERSHNRSQLEFLYRLARYFKPGTILEIGTAAGISTLYLGKGSPDSRLITMEGCMGLAGVAKKSFKKRNMNIELEVGNFDDILDHVLEGVDTLDMVFFDGNHRKEPTLDYYNKCVRLANENSVFLFDDIHWSYGMEKAWNMIKKDERVSISIDLYWIGLVFFRKGVAKQDFVIRY